tara:strand:- start:5720 stop:6325 length:606 start_codon:yes stop_codon:yes gene_type:complete
MITKKTRALIVLAVAFLAGCAGNPNNTSSNSSINSAISGAGEVTAIVGTAFANPSIAVAGAVGKHIPESEDFTSFALDAAPDGLAFGLFASGLAPIGSGVLLADNVIESDFDISKIDHSLTLQALGFATGQIYIGLGASLLYNLIVDPQPEPDPLEIERQRLEKILADPLNESALEYIYVRNQESATFFTQLEQLSAMTVD